MSKGLTSLPKLTNFKDSKKPANFFCFSADFPADIYLFKVKNRNTRKRYEIYSKLTMKTPERRQYRHSGVFVANFEHILHLFLVFLLLTLNRQMHPGLRTFAKKSIVSPFKNY